MSRWILFVVRGLCGGIALAMFCASWRVVVELPMFTMMQLNAAVYAGVAILAHSELRWSRLEVIAEETREEKEEGTDEAASSGSSRRGSGTPPSDGRPGTG